MADSPETLVGDGADSDGELSEEGARRLILVALASFVAFLLAAGVALAISRNDDGGSGADQVVAPGDPLAGTGTGPLAGTDVATYVEGRNRALREARGRWVAVVSLRDYLTEEAFRSGFGAGGSGGVSVEGVLVAAPAGEPEVVKGTGSLTKWATEERAEAEEERRQLDTMVQTTDDKAFQDQFRADMARLDKLLASLDPAKPVVFGVVVTGSAEALRALAGRADVRLIDLIGRRLPSDLTRLQGLRPEETVRASDPLTRPAA